jgi:leader peptidase (prepilin peptidase)/N-methyltransferase
MNGTVTVSGPAFAGLFGVLGLLVGSFLNVCIYRLPRKETILWGRSHCPHCGRQIRAWENVPVLSWLWLRGRCAGCQAPISLQYPLVELTTGFVFFATAWLVGPTLLLIPRLMFAAAMIVLFMIDLNERILPNVITLPGIVAGLLFSLVGPPGFRDALIGAIACSLSLWGVGEAVSRLLGKDALGFGDVKMVAMMGAFLGWKLTLVALFMASFLGSVIGIALVVITRDRVYLIPLGSFLAIGALGAASVGDPLIAWYVGRMLVQ